MSDSERLAREFLTAEHGGAVLHWIPEHLDAVSEALAALLEQVRAEERKRADEAFALMDDARECRDELRAVLKQAIDADAFHEWFTDTDEDGVDVCAVLERTDPINRSIEIRARSESKETPA